MSTIITRAGKGSALTHAELDTNFKTAAQAKTGAYTVSESDNRDTIECDGTFAVTLPDAATVAAAADTGDFVVTIKNIGTGTITIDRTTGADTIDAAASDITLEQYESVGLKVNQAGDGYNIIASHYGDASSVDGLNASQFLRSDANDTASGDLTLSGAVDLTGTWLIGATQVTSTAAELNILDGVTSTAAEINYLDLSTGAGTAEPSKALVYDANLHATHDVTSDEWQMIFAGTASTSYFWANAGGDVGLYDLTGTEHVLIFDESADTLTTQKPFVASDGITGNLTGDVTGNVSGSSGSCTGNSATATSATTATSHDGILVNEFTGTFTSLAASGVTSADHVMPTITTIYGASIVMTDADGADIVVQDSGGYKLVTAGEYSGGSYPGGNPASGSVRVVCHNTTAGTLTYNYRLLVWGT